MGGGQSSPAPPPGPPPVPPAPVQKPVFKKPDPKILALQIGPGKSTNCLTCAITIDPTLSSATVVLSRDILGKILAPPKPYPPSNLPDITKRPSDGGGYEVPYPNKLNGIGREEDLTTLSWKNETLLSDHENHWQDHASNWTATYNEQKAVEEKHMKEWDKKYNMKKAVRIWNPSDDPTDPKQSIAVNNLEYGALTKLFIKPTIPFPISFSLTGAKAVKSEPPPPPPADLPSYSQHEQDTRLTQQQINQNIESNRLERAKQARQGQPQDPLYVPPTTSEYMASNNH
jgi:hypothetical protein